MQDANDYNKLIEDYLDGSMSSSEKDAFEKMLSDNPELKKAFNERQKLETLWTEAERYENIKSQVKDIINLEKASKRRHRQIWLIAASIIILIGISSMLVFQYVPFWKTGTKNTYALTDSLYNDTVQRVLSMKKIVSLASQDTIQMEDIEYLAPGDFSEFSENDTIIFRWNPTNKEMNLFIKSIARDSIIYQAKIEINTSSFTIKPNSLSADTFEWYINDSSISRRFIVRED